MEWYYVKNGESCGPVGQDELERMARAGRLGPDDLVWNSTMGTEWRRAGAVEGLFAKPPDVLPPLSPARAARDAERPGAVGLAEPVRQAWERMKLILFKPFDIGKWFIIGFSAWLATLGEGGSSFSGPGNLGGGSSDVKHGDMTVDGMLTGMEEAWKPVSEFMHKYGGIVIVGVVLIVLIGMALGIVLLWLRSRGKFMLLDNVLKNRGQVKEPWHQWKQHGNSLFRWSFGYGLVCLVITLFLLALSWPLVIKPCVDARAFVAPVIGGLVAIVLAFLIFGLVTFYIGRFLEDFIIPIMYKHDLTASEAWRKFLGLYHANSGRFLLYGLFFMVLQACAGMAILALVLVTCCLAGLLMAVPFLGAVVLLPVTVFFRLYSVEYLAQYGGDFAVAAEGD